MAVYALITIATSWPVVLNLGSSIIGPPQGDNFFSVWSLWWYCHALSTGQDPAYSHFIFSLGPSAEVFVDGAVDTIASCPMQWFISPLAAYNLLVLLSYVLAGLFTYVLAQAFVSWRLACFVAGVFYSFSCYHLAHGLGHMGLLTVEFLPFAAWTLVRFYRRPGWSNAILCGVGVASVPLSEAYFVPYFLVPFLLVCAATLLLFDRAWLRDGAHLLQSALAAAVAAALALPPLATSFFGISADVRYALQLQASIIFKIGADPLEFVFPNPSNPLLGPLTAWLYNRMSSVGYGVEQSAFLGYPLIALGLLAFTANRGSRRPAAFWGVVTVCGLILSLGPTISVLGQSLTPNPFYRLLLDWGPLSSFRAPARAVVLALVGMSVLSALGLAKLFEITRGSGPWRVVLTATCVALVPATIAENAITTMPIPSSPLSTPQLYRIIAGDASPGRILDVPVVPIAEERELYFQTVHQHPLVFGYGPRVTVPELESVEGAPYLAQFVSYTTPDVQSQSRKEGDIFPVPGLRTVLELYDIRYVILHTDSGQGDVVALRNYLLRNLGAPFDADGADHLTAWRIPNPGPRLNRLTLYRLGAGWDMATDLLNGRLERILLAKGVLLLRVPAAETRRLSLLATPLYKPNALRIGLNGRGVETVQLSPVWATTTIVTPPLSLRPGWNTITLDPTGGCTYPPPDATGAQDPRCYSIGVQRVRLDGTSSPQSGSGTG